MLAPYQDEDLTALRRAQQFGGSAAGGSPGASLGSGALTGGGASPLSPPQPLMPKGRELNDAPPSPISDMSGHQLGGPAAPAPAAGGAPGGVPATTFAQLQASGIARPAPPPAAFLTPLGAGGGTGGPPMDQGGGMPLTGGNATPTAQDTGEGQPIKPEDSGPDPTAPPPGQNHPTDEPPPGSQPPGGPAPGQDPSTQPPSSTPPGSTPPAANGKYPLQDEIEAAIKKMLGMGSPYDDAAFNADVQKGYNAVDDQYALGQKDLTDELGRRGLGTSNDSSIGLGRMSDLNVARKSAKESVLTDLSSQRARSMMSDMASVLGIATNYGQGAQQLSFEQQMAIAQLLAQLGYKLPGK